MHRGEVPSSVPPITRLSQKRRQSNCEIDNWGACLASLSSKQNRKSPEAIALSEGSRGARAKTFEKPYSNGCFFTLPSARVPAGMRTMLHTPITHRPIRLESRLEPRRRHRANLILPLFPLRNRISLKTNAKLDSNPHTQAMFEAHRTALESKCDPRKQRANPGNSPAAFRNCISLKTNAKLSSKQGTQAIFERITRCWVAHPSSGTTTLVVGSRAGACGLSFDVGC